MRTSYGVVAKRLTRLLVRRVRVERRDQVVTGLHTRLGVYADNARAASFTAWSGARIGISQLMELIDTASVHARAWLRAE